MITLIYLIGFLAILGVVFWFIQKLSLPQPFMLVIYAACAILAILLIMSLMSGGIPSLHLSR